MLFLVSLHVVHCFVGAVTTDWWLGRYTLLQEALKLSTRRCTIIRCKNYYQSKSRQVKQGTPNRAIEKEKRYANKQKPY